MRLLVLSVFFITVAGCTCGGCEKKGPASPDASTGEAALTAFDAGLVANDGGDDDASVVEATDDSEDDSPEGVPTEAEVVAAFAADCHHQVVVPFSDMGEDRRGSECEARSTDQNCSPDVFGCWGAVENCRDNCSKPCNACQDECADTCDTCKTRCDGGDCVTECATARADCRRTCIDELETCRSTTCEKEYETCESEAETRRKTQCPDCAAISECLSHAGDSRESCLTEGNAQECLEWCAPY